MVRINHCVLWQVFDEVDVDKSGKISPGEFKTFCMKCSLSAEEAEEVREVRGCSSLVG